MSTNDDKNGKRNIIPPYKNNKHDKYDIINIMYIH